MGIGRERREGRPKGREKERAWSQLLDCGCAHVYRFKGTEKSIHISKRSVFCYTEYKCKHKLYKSEPRLYANYDTTSETSTATQTKSIYAKKSKQANYVAHYTSILQLQKRYWFILCTNIRAIDMNKLSTENTLYEYEIHAFITVCNIIKEHCYRIRMVHEKMSQCGRQTTDPEQLPCARIKFYPTHVTCMLITLPML